MNAANITFTADTASNRESFRAHRNYSSVALITPRETFIWEAYQEWLTWGPEFLASVCAAKLGKTAIGF